MDDIGGVSDLMEIISYCFLEKNGNVIKSKNYKLPVVPASNMKLVTTISALDFLGTDFRFNTRFYSRDNELHLAGDPAFFLNDSIFTKNVMKTGLKKPDIIYLENPKIDGTKYNRNWSYGDSDYSFQPKVTNFFINENCIIKDGLKFNEDDYDYIHQNEELFVPLRNPYTNFRKALGIANEKLPIKRPKKNHKEIENSFSYKVGINNVLKHILYESCNFYAEVVFKYLSSLDTDTGSWEASAKMIKERLSKINGAKEIRIIDGSGLSKDNFLTTWFLSNLLLYAREKFGESFIKLLPTSGLGTLRKRLGKLKDYGIYAKTGTLFGVSSLSGYIESLEISFSIIMNNSLEKAKSRQEMIDKILVDFIREYEKK